MANYNSVLEIRNIKRDILSATHNFNELKKIAKIFQKLILAVLIKQIQVILNDNMMH